LNEGSRAGNAFDRHAGLEPARIVPDNSIAFPPSMEVSIQGSKAFELFHFKQKIKLWTPAFP